MILTIDTDKERPERLEEIAAFLLKVAGKQSAIPSADVEASPEMFSIFGDEEKPKVDDEETASVVSELLANDDTSRVTPY